MARKKLSYPDHAWLRMDEPNNPMIITGLMTFSTEVDFERLKTKIGETLWGFRRFRQRLVPSRLPFRRPYWVDDPHYNLDAHVQPFHLPEPADKHVLQEFISLVMSRGLDHDRPLWMFYVVDNYEGGSALIGRMHHSLADGMALMQVLLSMTDTKPEPELEPQAASEAEPDAEAEQGKVIPISTSNAAAINTNGLDAGSMLHEGRLLFTDREHVRLRTRQSLKFAGAVGRLALRWPDPHTLFKGSLNGEKRAAWSDPLSLADVKHIGHACNATVNDVLLASVAGALGRYLDTVGELDRGLRIRGIIPVNLRPIVLDEDLGNKFGLVFLSLPVGEEDPLARLQRVKQNMDDLKSSVEPAATFVILNVIGAVPAGVERIATQFFDSKGSAVMTNVPGPQIPLYLAGAPIEALMAWVPQSGRISLGVSIISYNGKVWLGVATDANLVPDPESIVAYFQHEFQALMNYADQPQAVQPASMQSLLDRLDEALRSVDELLEERQTAPAEPAEATGEAPS
jgi:diacylglycerol O-acyltransferase